MGDHSNNDALTSGGRVSRLFHSLEILVNGLNRFIGESTGLIYFVVFAIGIQEVFLRYAFNAPTTWALEISIALCGIQYCLAAGNTHRLNRHVRIEVIYLLLPRRVQQACDVVAEMIVFTTVASICYGGAIQAERALSAWQTTGSAFNSPSPTFMKLAIPIGAGLVLLQSLVKIGGYARRPSAGGIANER